jgi:endoglucanase
MTAVRTLLLSTVSVCAFFGCVQQEIGAAPGGTDASTTRDGSKVNDASKVTDAGEDAPVYPNLPAVPLHTQSRFIMDAKGKRIKLAGVSWYGGESADFVPMGLDHADVHDIAHAVKLLGFNSVRLPWALQLYEENPVVTASLVSANTSLQGKTVLEVFDAVIDALAQEGLVVILDNHRSRGDWCCDTAHGDGLWHTVQYPETNFFADWEAMVKRYQGNPAVVGVDLRNELRGQLPDEAGASCIDCDVPAEAGCACLQPSWGDNNPLTDWAAASERVGNALLAINPSLLVIVEGDFYATWFGANYRPVQLNVPNRLVYSPHNYAGSNGGAASFANYAAFKAALDSAWGYLITENQAYTAPVWVGEFGADNTSPDSTSSDLDGGTDGGTNPNASWWVWIRQYLADNDLDWAVWALNGTEGPGYGRTFGAQETFGVVETDWITPAPQPFISALQALQPATILP